MSCDELDPLVHRHVAELAADQADLVVRALAEPMRGGLLEAHDCRPVGADGGRVTGARTDGKQSHEQPGGNSALRRRTGAWAATKRGCPGTADRCWRGIVDVVGRVCDPVIVAAGPGQDLPGVAASSDHHARHGGTSGPAVRARRGVEVVARCDERGLSHRMRLPVFVGRANPIARRSIYAGGVRFNSLFRTSAGYRSR